MLKRFGVISHMMFLDMQDYEEIVTHYNLSNSHDKPVSVFNNDSYDIFEIGRASCRERECGSV